jgi:hypothetical protein
MSWVSLGFYELSLPKDQLENPWVFPFGDIPVAPIDAFAIRILYSSGQIIKDGKAYYPTIFGGMCHALFEPPFSNPSILATRQLHYSHGDSVVYPFGPTGETFNPNTGEFLKGSMIWNYNDASEIFELRNNLLTKIGFRAYPKKRGVSKRIMPTDSGFKQVYPWWYEDTRRQFTIQVELWTGNL